jgi:YhcH/YjgK/YiaL family protein
MIFETLATFPRNPLVVGSSLIARALEWAARIDATTEPGRFELDGDDFYASVQLRQPRPREERSTPEAHREYVDLQYCVAGGEIIDWYALDGLQPTMEHDEAGDYRLFRRPAHPPVPLLMRPGTFALLFPRDAHVPMVADGVNSECRMVVFKIRCSLFEREAVSSAR